MMLRPQFSNDVSHSGVCTMYWALHYQFNSIPYFGNYCNTYFHAKMVSIENKIMWHVNCIIAGQYTKNSED